MENNKIFADGLMWKDAHEKAPPFVKGTILVEASKFKAFMEANVQYISPKGWLTIDMKESKKGGIYFELNTWKPETSKPEGTGSIPISKPTSTSGSELMAKKRFDPETGEELPF